MIAQFKLVKRRVEPPKRTGPFAWLFIELFPDYEHAVVCCACGEEFEYHSCGRGGTCDTEAVIELMNHLLVCRPKVNQ